MVQTIQYYISILLICFSSIAFSQTALTRMPIDLLKNGQILNNGAAGGLNRPQYSAADLNNDGTDDLVVFDKEDNKILTFINNGTANQIDYTFAPAYAENFPDVTSWALMRDYNCDGIPDLIARPPEPVDGAAVYKGYYDLNGQLAFNRVLFPNHFSDVIFYFNINNFPVSAYIPQTDIPAVDDIDGDGDLDLLSFRQLGSYVIYYENQSVEMGFGCDSLIFELKTDCWGRFFESGANNGISLSPSLDSCYGTQYFVAGKGPRHAGSTILSIDLDNDQDKELIIGDISFNNLVMVSNGGTADTAFMTSQDSNFPSYDRPLNIETYPGAFSLDVNNDGANDLLVSPTLASSENQAVTWFYQNTTDNAQPSFQFLQEDFLVGDMIDLGSSASPTFFDYNADGLLDILVGSMGLFDNGNIEKGRLALFENVGTATNPSFELIDDNYLNIAAFNLLGISPTVGDLDGDGDQDILFGDFDGLLYFLENTAGAGNTAVFGAVVPGYAGIQVGIYSTPSLVDVDRDGLTDIVIGDVNGILYFYQNTGAIGNPSFTLLPNGNPNGSFGDVDVRQVGFSSGYSAPSFYDNKGIYELYVGSQQGFIHKYGDIEQNLTTPFTQITTSLGDTRESTYSKIAVADINNDDYVDIIVGTRRGGLAFFSSDLYVNTDPDLKKEQVPVSITPNPAKDFLTINITNSADLLDYMTVYNSIGQVTLQHTFNTVQSSYPLDVSKLAKGIYFIKIKIGEQFIVKKIVIQ